MTVKVGRPSWLEERVEVCRAWFHPDLLDDDLEWVRANLIAAGVVPPPVDVSWLRMVEA